MVGNRVVTSRLVGVRDGATGKQLGVRLQLAAGDLPAGWYTVLVPLDAIRPWDADQDGALTRDERTKDETTSDQERMAALLEGRPSSPDDTNATRPS
jgi:hypothetical protein